MDEIPMVFRGWNCVGIVTWQLFIIEKLLLVRGIDVVTTSIFDGVLKFKDGWRVNDTKNLLFDACLRS